MNVKLFTNPRHFVIVLATALVLAMTAASASVWIDEVAGTSLTPAVFACHPQGSGCG